MPRRPGEQFTKRRQKEIQNRYNKARPERHQFYSSAAWRKLRDWYRKEHPLCEACQERGLVKVAQLVDHIVEIKDGGAPLDPANLQSLCGTCHNRKHGNLTRDTE